MPALAAYAGSLCKSSPVSLTVDHANALLAQLQETAGYRGWRIDAAAILVNHVHIVFGVAGNPEPEGMLRDWKSYASRKLNRGWGQLPGGWWARGGSKRPLPTARCHWAAIRYVRDQQSALVVWVSEQAKAWLSEPPAH
jgi:REP element-mobilizing transposase RayT